MLETLVTLVFVAIAFDIAVRIVAFLEWQKANQKLFNVAMGETPLCKECLRAFHAEQNRKVP